MTRIEIMDRIVSLKEHELEELSTGFTHGDDRLFHDALVRLSITTLVFDETADRMRPLFTIGDNDGEPDEHGNGQVDVHALDMAETLDMIEQLGLMVIDVQ